jgi:hypothetical protein
MRLFCRRSDVPDPRTRWPEQRVPADAKTAAAAFWNRWFELLPEISAALGDREPQRVEHDLCGAIALVHPDPAFLSRARATGHLRAGGDRPRGTGIAAVHRRLARRSAPEDAIWEYHDSVPPVPDPAQVTVNLGEHRISLADVRVAAQADEAESAVDVTVHGAGFRRAQDAYLPVGGRDAR